MLWAKDSIYTSRQIIVIDEYSVKLGQCCKLRWNRASQFIAVDRKKFKELQIAELAWYCSI